MTRVKVQIHRMMSITNILYETIMKNFLTVTYIGVYMLLIAASFTIFWLFRPFSYTDNNTSRLLCRNTSRVEIGPNSVYTFGDKLDAFNDKKARKVCEYNMMYDYGDTLKTPETVNYTLEIKKIQDTSWLESGLIGIVFFILGTAFIEFIIFGLETLLHKRLINRNVMTGRDLLTLFERLVT